MRHSVGRKIAAGFGVTLAILLVIALVSYQNTRALVENAAWVTRSHEVLKKLENVLSSLKGIETEERGFVITGEEAFLEPERPALGVISQETRRLRELTSNDAAQQRRLDALEPLIAEKIKWVKQIVLLRRTQGFEAARERVVTGTGKAVMDQIHSLIHELKTAEQRLLGERNQQAESSARRAIQTCILGCILAFLLVGLASVLIRRDIAERKKGDAVLRQSEERFRLLADAMPQIVWTARPDGWVDYYNQRWFDYTGLSLEETQGWGWGAVLYPSDLQPCTDCWKNAVETGASYQIEYRFKRASDGAYRWHLGRATPVRDRDNRIVKWFGTCTDIDDQKRAEELLRDAQERLARLVETIADGIFIVDRNGSITFANAAAEKILLQTREVITSRTHNDPVWKITKPDGKPFPDEDLPFTRVMRTGEPVYGIEVGVERSDGSRIVVSVNAASLRDASGEVMGMVSSVSDITRRKEIERMKDEFVSTVSHELRTPLTSLRGFAELMLAREFGPEKQREFLTIIRNESIRLTNLINDFLDIQRMEAGSQRYAFEVADLAALLRDTLAVFSGGEKKHTFAFEVPDALPPVWADPDRIRQVLSNLVSNAVKFSPAEGTVTVGAREENGSVLIWVQDQGIGIPAEALPKLFKKFFRVDNRETRSVGGTGLGLALVKEIVEAHRGDVWVESEPAKGSTFFLTLPVAQTHPVTVPAPQIASGDTVDILIVEDDAAFSILLSEHLQAEGLTVASTATGEEALELVRHSSPRLVILDIHLAGRTDGWDVLMSLKGHPFSRAIPVLIISASDTINARGLALGGADYLLKPISPQWLLETVQRHLPTLPGKRVLIVDDDAAFRLQVKDCLAAENVEVEEAENGREAQVRMGQAMPDLLLLDLLMPEVDGFEVLQRLRSDKRAVNLPVLVITGKDLIPEDKLYLKRRMATLVRKREVSLAHIAQAAEKMLGVLQLDTGVGERETGS